MLEIYSLFLNEEWHTNNISVIKNPEYMLCRYFDQGLSLLFDLDEFWLMEMLISIFLEYLQSYLEHLMFKLRLQRII